MVTTMSSKWKCTNCDSINHTAEGEPKRCFVCGALNEERSAESVVFSRPAAADTEPSLLERIKRWLGLSAPEAIHSEAPPSDWKIRSSPEDEDEAYLTAEPVYSGREAIHAAPTAPELPVRPHVSAVPEAAYSVELDPAPAGAISEPWPEHRIRFRMDKLGAIGCTGVARDELNGTRGYRLTLAGGATRYMTVNNMKMMGYAENI